MSAHPEQPASTGTGITPAEETSSFDAPRLLRIGSMIRELLNEVRASGLDDGARQHMRNVYERTIDAVRSMLPDELQSELDQLTVPFSSDDPSEPELRVVQAQLVGWLEGLFHGIQATLWAQQMQRQAELQQFPRRSLPDSQSGQGAYL